MSFVYFRRMCSYPQHEGVPGCDDIEEDTSPIEEDTILIILIKRIFILIGFLISEHISLYNRTCCISLGIMFGYNWCHVFNYSVWMVLGTIQEQYATFTVSLLQYI